jgi:peptide/nickel transport system substrate-binding protein
VTYNLRWQILLALVAFGLVVSLLSFQVQGETAVFSPTTCTEHLPAPGGIFAEGMVGAPLYLNPLLSDNQPIDHELVSLIFDGLTRYGVDGRLQPALAQSWQVAEDNLSVHFSLREDATWHDGQPVTTNDVAFTYGLMQADDFPGPADLKTLWQSVTINVIDEQTIEFVLMEPYSPFLDATTRGIMPAHLLRDVTAASLPNHPFNLAPVGTGPFLVEPGQDWRANGRLRLIPAPTQWPQGTQLTALEFHFYPDENSLVAAFANGEIQAVNRVTAESLPILAADPHLRLFTAPLPRYTALFFNVSESGATAVQSLAVRQALAYALDRNKLVDEALNGQAVPLEGPYLPSSWAYNPVLLTPYSYQPVTATNLLETAEWTLPEGATTRQQGEQTLNLRLLVLNNPTHQALAQIIAEQWASLGITAEWATADDVNALRTALIERTFDVALVEINPPGDPDLYDFWSQEAIVRGQNFAGWNNRRASEALEAARQIWSVGERRPYYDTFLRLFNSDLPALTLFQHVYTYGVTDEVNGVEIGRIDSSRDRYQTFANWYTLTREVAVACPTESAP